MEKLNHRDREQLIQTRAACVCHNLRRSARAVTRFYDEALAPAHLPANQMAILVGIAIADRPTISALARDMAMDPSTLSRNLHPLEREGLIQVKAKPKERRKHLSVTAKGMKRIKQALPLWAKAQAKLAERMKAGQCEGVVADLAAITSHAQALAEPV